MTTTPTLRDLVKAPEFREELMAEFFAAMRRGYAAIDPKFEPYQNGKWRITDSWYTTFLSDRSGGEVVIKCNGETVWMMQYFGQYEKLATPCLKAALRDAYTRNEFIGGRGPDGFRHDGMTYFNTQKPEEAPIFDLFRGQEWITRADGQELGFHCYQGGFMF